jgi:hypothetical protein
MPTTLQQRLLAHLHELAHPRHAQWDRLGLMSVRAFIHEQLAALGPVQEHTSQEDSEAGTKGSCTSPPSTPSSPPAHRRPSRRASLFDRRRRHRGARRRAEQALRQPLLPGVRTCSGPLQFEALLTSDLRWDRSHRCAALGAEDHVDHQSCSR